MGFATEEPDLPDQRNSSSNQDMEPSETVVVHDGEEVGGEYMHDVDDSLNTDDSDIEQTNPMTGGTIAGGLGGSYDGSGTRSGFGDRGDELDEGQQQQVDATDDTTNEFVEGTEAQEATHEWWNRNTPNVPGDSDGDGVPDGGALLAIKGAVVLVGMLVVAVILKPYAELANTATGG